MGGRGDGSGRGAGLRAIQARPRRHVLAFIPPLDLALALGMLLGLGCLFTPQPALAGAWTLPAGSGQVIVQTTVATSNQEFGPSSDLLSSRPYDKAEVDLVFEYGATDWLTLIAAPQFLAVRLGEPGSASYAGPGYTSLGARVRLYESETFVLSAQAVARISGTGNSQSAAAVGYEDGELDLRVLAGLSFTLFGKPAYLDLQAAQRQRSGPPPDEFHLDATLGVRVAERWQVLAQSFNVVSEGAGEGPYFGASYEYYKLQLGAAYDWTPALTLQLSVVGTYFARNAPQENGLVLSAQYRF
jgi:hypothetical protein